MKNEIATSVLGVCPQDMQFIYILPGWEGSTADSRVLRNAISRGNGLKVLKGFYYLCDVRREMTLDPLEAALGDRYMESEPMENADVIQYIETSNERTTWRDNLAQDMWNQWLASRNQT
ncbi:hypothetical protein PTKIN_Ptkin01aG0248900 [Pterospermum kingtungense]